MNIDPRINQLFSTLSLNHAQKINRNAFNEIAQCLFSFHDKSNETNIKEVVEAFPGHGKSTVLTSYCKWLLTHEEHHQPVLICTKEKHLAYDIYREIKHINPDQVVNLDSENKDLYEDDLKHTHIIIMQHQRLKNLALGFGTLSKYTDYKYNTNSKLVKRLLIIDEKPDFIDSVIFDINSINNVLDWFEDLAEPLKISPVKSQRFKSYIMFLISTQLCENNEDKTTILTKYFNDEKTNQELISLLNDMETHDGNKNKYESLNTMKHFINLLKLEEYGRIDEYYYNNTGRKIIISKYIDYGLLGMNILIFDGTMRSNGYQYGKGKFHANRLTNWNDYTRLHFHIEEINTSKYSRSKENYTTQKTISQRIKELKKIHRDLFILPMKDEISIYIDSGAIGLDDQYLYFDKKTDQTKGINLLNTLGKNILNDKKSLYLTSLPKKNADFYKCIAIAIYGTDVNLMMNDENKNNHWFIENKMENIYKGELISELMQIIHRTALRNLNGEDEIHIYIAYDEDKEKWINGVYQIYPIYNHINNLFLNDKMVVHDPVYLVNMHDYGHIEKIKDFSIQINQSFNKDKRVKSIRISKISKSFQNYINKHWNNKSKEINEALNCHGYIIEIKKDRYSNESKYISKV